MPRLHRSHQLRVLVLQIHLSSVRLYFRKVHRLPVLEHSQRDRQVLVQELQKDYLQRVLQNHLGMALRNL